jgi:hypothetical protein
MDRSGGGSRQRGAYHRAREDVIVKILENLDERSPEDRKQEIEGLDEAAAK